MRVRFYSLNRKHLVGLGFRFWFRENITYINQEAAGIFSDYWYSPPKLTDWKEWFWLISIPFFYVLAFFIGPWWRRAEAIETAKPDYETFFYNKKNIEYMTVVHTLGGEIGR